MAQEEKWLTRKQVADACNVHPRTLDRWRMAGYGPPLFRFGKRLYGWPKEIQLWITAQRWR